MPEMNDAVETTMMETEKTSFGTYVLGALVLGVSVLAAFTFGGRYLKAHPIKQTEYTTVEGGSDQTEANNEGTAENN